MDIHNFISLCGIVVIFVIAWIFSSNRSQINWHIALWGIGLQMLIAWFLFIFPVGAKVFQVMNNLVLNVLESSTAGAQFVFGRLAISPGAVSGEGETSLGFIFAFQVFPTIIFFSSLVSVLYYLRIIPRVIQAFACLFTRLMNISGAESVCAASNVFVGVESALAVRPYLLKMTSSELCLVLTAGMATVSSNVIAIYVFSLQDIFPNIAGHLISASLLSVPAAIAVSKVLWPETGRPVTLGDQIEIPKTEDHNIFEAIINGSMAGVKLIVGIVALLIAILGLVSLVDQSLAVVSSKIGGLLGLNISLSLTKIVQIFFYPLTYLMGVASQDVYWMSYILSERLILTEVVSYQHLAELIDQGVVHSKRSIFIVSYALCGFAHVASLGIFVGGLSALIPSRVKDLTQVAGRALFAATLACFLTGCVAGLFYLPSFHDGSLRF